MPRKVGELTARALTVDCTKCESKVGEGCKTTSGARTQPHFERIQESRARIEVPKKVVAPSEYVEVLHEVIPVSEEDRRIEATAEKVAIYTLRAKVQELEEQVRELTDTCAKQAMIIVRTMATCEPVPSEIEEIYKGLEGSVPTFDTVISHFANCLKVLKTMNAQDREDAQRFQGMLKIINMQ